MPLGLDLRGGLYLMYEVDLNGAISQLLDSYEQDFRRALSSKNIIFSDVVPLTRDDGVSNGLRVSFPPGTDLGAAREAMQAVAGDLTLDSGGGFIEARMTAAQVTERQRNAIQQNIVTLRNRVSELGVSEPIVQQQGLDRIVVQLPGVLNSAEVKDILGRVATLEFRLTDVTNSVQEAVARGRAPLGSKLYYHRERDGVRQPTLLMREVIATGDQLVDATSTVGQDGPAVAIRLNAQAGDEMLRITQSNVGRPMAVILIEQTTEKAVVNGETVDRKVTRQEVISEATIRGVFGNQFNITGLSPGEARDLALLMRSGQLAAAVSIVNERVIGPSLGQVEHRGRREGAGDRHARAVRVHDPLLPRVRRRGLDRAAGERRAAHRAAVADEGVAFIARPGGHPAHRRHGGGRQRDHLRAHPRGTARRHVAAGGHPRRLREGVLGDPGLERDHADRGPGAVGVRHGSDPQLRHRAHAGHRHVDVHLVVRQPRAADAHLWRQDKPARLSIG